jgi:phosphatidylglycerol:prolipoprotein diacylglycerol transferase
MTFQSPGQIIFSLGPLTLRWYGLITVLAFFVALYYSKFLLKASPSKDFNQYNDFDKFQDFALLLFFSGIVGARLWFVLLNLDYFSKNLSEIPMIWLGGQSIHGAMIGAAIASFIYCKFNLQKIEYRLSIVAAVAPLGQAIGRWGNFFNEEAFGSVTNLPWGLYISHTGQHHHPAFLYEAIGNLFIAFILLVLIKKNFVPKIIIATYFILYSLLRIMIESIRLDSLYAGSIPAATLTSYVLIFVALLLIVRAIFFERRPFNSF